MYHGTGADAKSQTPLGRTLPSAVLISWNFLVVNLSRGNAARKIKVYVKGKSGRQEFPPQLTATISVTVFDYCRRITARELLHAGEASQQAIAETFGQVNRLFCAQQLNHVAHAVIYGGAMRAVPQMAIDTLSQLRLDIFLHVIHKLSANFIAVEFQDDHFARHVSVQTIRCSASSEVTNMRSGHCAAGL